MKITKHGQSCFLLETEKGRVLVDPGIYAFNEEGIKPGDFQDIDVLVITHEHPDHFDVDQVVEIIKNSNPKIFSTDAVINTIDEKLPSRTEKEIPAGLTIERYKSQHGPLPTGAVPPQVNGYVISDGRTSFYTPGDSIYLDPNAKADAIAVPICGEVVMDIEQARAELLKANPKLAIPIHYDNPRFPVNVDDFMSAMQDTEVKVQKLNWGESVEI